MRPARDDHFLKMTGLRLLLVQRPCPLRKRELR